MSYQHKHNMPCLPRQITDFLLLSHTENHWDRAYSAILSELCIKYFLSPLVRVAQKKTSRAN